MIPRSGGIWVFAVEDTSAQVTWRNIGHGNLRVAIANRVHNVALDGGPGCLNLDQLEPDTEYRATVDTTGSRASSRRIRIRTLPAPLGPELYRFATLTDVHLARRTFGVKRLVADRPGDEAHTIRCTRAALVDIEAWGAASLVVKGDLVESSHPHNWDSAGELLGRLAIPVDLIVGNHELNRTSTADAFAEAERVGLTLHRGFATIDRPGLRLILLDSAIPVLHRGRWAHRSDAAADAARDASGAAMVIAHHQPQRTPVQTYFPPGIGRSEATAFARRLAMANPATMGTSGHTHRHRRHTIAGIPWTETGSPKDYPGSWTGYAVHEGGIRQVVRRVSDPDALEWLDRTAHAAVGLWGLWSPGRLSDRCFTWRWPAR